MCVQGHAHHQHTTWLWHKRHETAAYCVTNTSSVTTGASKNHQYEQSYAKTKKQNRRKKKEREKLDCMHLNWSGEMQEATLTTPPLTHSSLYRWMSLFHHWNTTRSNDRYSPLQPCQKDAVSSSRQDSKQCRRAVSGKFSSFQRYFSFTWPWEANRKNHYLRWSTVSFKVTI